MVEIEDAMEGEHELALLSDDFHSLGFQIINKTSAGSIQTQFRRFKAHFGIDWLSCAKFWLILSPLLIEVCHKSAKPKHLLWTLIFLRLYDTEEILAAKVDADEKTFRKWVWICIELMAYLQVDFVSLSYSLIFHLF